LFGGIRWVFPLSELGFYPIVVDFGFLVLTLVVIAGIFFELIFAVWGIFSFFRKPLQLLGSLLVAGSSWFGCFARVFR